MQEFLSDPAELLGALEAHAPEAIDQKNFLGAAASLARGWTDFERSRIRGMLLATIFRIEVLKTRVNIHIAPSRLAKVFRSGSMELPPAYKVSQEETHPVFPVSSRTHARSWQPRISQCPSETFWCGDLCSNFPNISLGLFGSAARVEMEALFGWKWG